MPTYPMTDHSGKVFDVTADNVQQAVKDFHNYQQDQMNKSYQQELSQTPPWQQIGKLGADALRTAVNVPTLGYADKFADYMQGTGDLEQMKTQASKHALGWGAPAIEIGTAAATIPSIVPKAVAAFGGGPAARTITGMTAGGAEGGLIGGINAAGHSSEGGGSDVGQGTRTGAITGMLGQAVGSAVNKGKRIWDEKVLGKAFEAPKYNVTIQPPKPDARDLVNVAAGQTTSKARLRDDPASAQQLTRTNFENLQATNPKKTFTKAQHEQLDKIIEGDPATRFTGAIGDYMSNKMSGSMIGTGVGGGLVGSAITGTVGPAIAGTLGPAAILAAGRGLKEVSAGGTREAVRDMRRMMYPNIDKFKPPTDPKDAARFANALRQLGIEVGY